jgi:hypothetical protein
MSKKRCQKGKSCGGTCIFRGLICRIDLSLNLSSSLDGVKGGLVHSSQPIKPLQSTRRGNIGKVESLALEVRRKRLSKQDYSNEWNNLTSLISKLEGDEKREASIKANLAIGKRLKIDIKHSAESEDGARSAGKKFLGNFKSLEKTVEIINRYDSLFQSIVSRLDPNSTREQLEKIQNKLVEINKRKGEFENKLERIMAGMRDRLMETNLSDKQVNDLLSRVWTGRASEKTREDITEFIRMFNGRGFSDVSGVDKVKAITSVADSDERAHAKLSKGFVSTYTNRATTFHELAHIVEAQRPWMSQYAVKWRDDRAYEMPEIRQKVGKNLTANSWYRVDSGSSVPLLKLKDLFIGSNYDEGELAIVDNFLSLYMGKVYHNPLAPAIPQKATEVWSVAVEYFASPMGMAALYKSHPELFEIVVGMATSP